MEKESCKKHGVETLNRHIITLLHERYVEKTLQAKRPIKQCWF